MKSFFRDNANDDKNKNKKFQQSSTGQSFESYVQKFRFSIKLFQTVAGLTNTSGNQNQIMLDKNRGTS